MQKIDVIRVDVKPTEGSRVYYQRSCDEIIHQGEVVECDNCKKSCISNGVGILAFENDVKEILVYNQLFDADELYYNEDFDECYCSSCGG